MTLLAVILPIMFFALVWHDKSAHAAVIEPPTTRRRLPYE